MGVIRVVVRCGHGHTPDGGYALLGVRP